MITHSLSGAGRGTKGYDAPDCAMISICWCPPGTVQQALQNLKNRSGERGTFSSFLRFPSGISSCQAFSERSLVPFPPRRTVGQTARTWCLCSHLMLARTFAWASTQCGIAKFCSCFPFTPAQTLEIRLELSATTARSYLCCGSMIKIHQVLNYAE